MFGEKSSEPKFEHISETLCEVQNCRGANFRGLGACVHHHLERVRALEEQRRIDEEKIRGLMTQDDWPKIWARGLFQSAHRICGICGKQGVHHVREKSKEKRPRRPNSYWEVLEAICSDCVDDGR